MRGTKVIVCDTATWHADRALARLQLDYRGTDRQKVWSLEADGSRKDIVAKGGSKGPLDPIVRRQGRHTCKVVGERRIEEDGVRGLMVARSGTVVRCE
jgi:hypothetical protein